ncbi:MAG: heavy metal-binding domain-containing protein, partial [Planctomycetota bacterium]
MEDKLTKSWSPSKTALIIIVLVIAAPQVPADTSAQKVTEWTCSMHPQIRQPKPGKCPLCFMDLIPVDTGSGQIGERQISFSEDALKLMEIQTSTVERKFVTAEIR